VGKQQNSDNYITLHPNILWLKSNGMTKERINVQKKLWDGINITKLEEIERDHMRDFDDLDQDKKIMLCNFKTNPTIFILKGDKEEVAYIEGNIENTDEIKIVIKYPLNLTIKEQRFWHESVSNFFKPRLNRRLEFYKAIDDNFEEKEYAKFKSMLDDKKGYGTQTNREERYEKRNEWIKEKYYELIRNEIPCKELHTSSSERVIEKIEEELKSLPKDFFGKWPFGKKSRRFPPFYISYDRIRQIIYSNKSKKNSKEPFHVIQPKPLIIVE